MSSKYTFHSWLLQKRVPVPPHVERELDEATTPRAIETILARAEPSLARIAGHRERDLDCDEMADLFSSILKVKGIPHELVVGTNDEGSAHSWVRVEGKDYDPTKQGTSKRFTFVKRYP